MNPEDRWLTRLRALAGIGTLAWELAAEHGTQWWAWIVVLYLLGAPFEDLVRLLTSGRILIERQDEEDRQSGAQHRHDSEDDGTGS